MKLREREGQNVDLERSLKGPLLIVDGRYRIVVVAGNCRLVIIDNLK